MRYTLSVFLSLMGMSCGAQASRETLFESDDTLLSSFLSPSCSFDEVIESPVASPVFSSSDSYSYSGNFSSSSEEERHFMDPWMAPSNTTPVPAWTPEMFFAPEESVPLEAPAVSSQNQPVESAILWDKDNSPPLLRDDVPALPGVQEEGVHTSQPQRVYINRITPKRLAHQAIMRQAKDLIRDLDAKDTSALKGKVAAYLTTRIIEVSGQLNASDPEKYALLSYGAQFCLNAQNYVRARWCVDQVLGAKSTYVRRMVLERALMVNDILLVEEQSKK